MKNPYSYGLERLANLQAKLGKPPKREHVKLLVEKVIRLSGLKGDAREQYFRLLATCAMKNLEPRFRNWNGLQTKGGQK